MELNRFTPAIKSLWLLVASMLCLMLMTTVAHAEPKPKEPGPLACSGQVKKAKVAESAGPDESVEDVGKNCNCRARHPGYLFSVIVPCIREEVRAATSRMTNAFAPLMWGTTLAFLTLVIVFFGVKLMTNDGDPKKDTMILLLKIAGVLGFLSMYNTMIIDPAFGIVQEGVEITTGAFDFTSASVIAASGDSDPPGLNCREYVEEKSLKDPSTGAIVKEPEKPWIYYDCVIGKLAGFGGKGFVGASALAIAGSALWSGQFGSIFVLGFIAAMFFLLKLIIRGAYTYLIALMALGLLIILSPLLIPLIWMQATQQYFDRWLNAFMAMMIMPAIVMGYLTFSYMVLDHIVFDEEMGVASLLNQDTVKEMRGQKEKVSDTHMASPTAADPAGTGVSKEHLESDSQVDPIFPFASGTGNMNWAFSDLYHIDFRGDEASNASKIFFAFVALLIVTYILMAMFNQLIQLSQVMLGGGFFLQSAVSDNPFERSLDSVQRGMAGSIRSSMQNASGPADKAAAMTRGIAQGIANIPSAMMSAMSDQATRR